MITGTDSFLPSGDLKLKWLKGPVVLPAFCLSTGLSIARTGSATNVRVEFVAIACAGSFTIGCIDFFVIACTGFLATTCSTSFAAFWSCAEKSNVEGANVCAYVLALEMMASEAVAKNRQTRPRTETSYAGSRNLRQAFF